MTDQGKKEESRLSKKVRELWIEYDRMGDLKSARAQQIRDEARSINQKLSKLRAG